MNLKGEITASEAREIASTVLSSNVIEKLEAIFAKIRAAVESNQFSCGCGLFISPHDSVGSIVIKELENRGFKVSHHSGDQRDPRESSWTEIRW